MGRSILYKIDVLQAHPDAHRADADAGAVQRRAVGADRRAARGDRGAQPGRFADQAIRIVSTFGIGFPPFWLGLMLIILFSVKLDIFPVSGYGDTFARQARASLSCPA